MLPRQQVATQGMDSLSLCVVWLCGIAYWRDLLDPSLFTAARFCGEKVQALNVPTPRKSELKHRGLFAWLYHDAPRLFEKRQNGGVMLLIWQNGIAKSNDEDDWNVPLCAVEGDERIGCDAVVVEAHEMRWSTCDDAGVDEERLQARVAQVLRTICSYSIFLGPLEKGCDIEIEAFDCAEDERAVNEKVRHLQCKKFKGLHTATAQISWSVYVERSELRVLSSGL